jgi:hypothetical protein
LREQKTPLLRGFSDGHGWFRTSDLSRVKRYRRVRQIGRNSWKSGEYGHETAESKFGSFAEKSAGFSTTKPLRGLFKSAGRDLVVEPNPRRTAAGFERAVRVTIMSSDGGTIDVWPEPTFYAGTG